MQNILKNILRFVVMTIAGVMYAVAIAVFIDPNNMAPGGVSGVSIIINRISGIETGTLILLFNIPIMILGGYVFGVRFMVSTIYTLIVASISTNILSKVGYVATEDRLLAAIIGGALLGAGLGLVFRAGATTGGTDIIVKIYRRKYPHIKSNQIFLVLDLIVILVSVFVFKNIEAALYAIVAIFASSVVMDRVLYGTGAGKLVYIVSKEYDIISKRIMNEIDVGVTYVKGEGAYTGEDKRLILCVVRNAILPKLRNIVKEEDNTAFLFISPATEVFGEGYRPHDSEEL